MKITAVIMCSGLSKRMGKNKLLIDFGGNILVDYIINTLTEIDFYRLLAVTSYSEINKYSDRLTIINNSENYKGISSSVILGTNNCGDCDGIMFFTADQPFMSKDVIEKLIHCFDKKNKITVPIVNGMPQNPVIFPIRYKNELLSLSGDCGGKKIYKKHLCDTEFVDFSDFTPFIDIDTEEDFKRYVNK